MCAKFTMLDELWTHRDGGAAWQHLGTALSETWHLSYPFVFLYQGEVYMLPEGYQVRAAVAGRATRSPLTVIIPERRAAPVPCSALPVDLGV